jgi:hypothetical protein
MSQKLVVHLFVVFKEQHQDAQVVSTIFIS